MQAMHPHFPSQQSVCVASMAEESANHTHVFHLDFGPAWPAWPAWGEIRDVLKVELAHR